MNGVVTLQFQSLVHSAMPSKDYAKCVKEMRDWLNSQPHLPKDVSDNMLCRFAHSCYFDLAQAKKAVETFFTLRRDYPHLFTDRDPNTPQMQKFVNAVKLAQLELSGRRKLWIYQLNDERHFDMVADARLNFLANDCWFLENQERFEENDVYYVADLRNISFRFLTKLNMAVANTYSKYQREAVPIRLKQLHLVSESPVLRKLFSLFKPLLSKDIIHSVHFHEANSGSLFKFFHRDELPADYGGARPPMAALMAQTMQLIERKRDTVLSKEFWIANEN